MSEKENNAVDALNFIIPILKRYKFNWIITGGFACYVYGVKRLITDIDIDIKISKDEPKFKLFLNEISQYVSQYLMHFKNKYYDNYNVEVNYNGQVIDICSSKELKIFNKKNKQYELIYDLLGGFPQPEFVKFRKLKLPLLPKELIIKNKEMIVRDKWDLRDIKGLRELS